jgi:hypothetical protein
VVHGLLLLMLALRRALVGRTRRVLGAALALGPALRLLARLSRLIRSIR